MSSEVFSDIVETWMVLGSDNEHVLGQVLNARNTGRGIEGLQQILQSPEVREEYIDGIASELNRELADVPGADHMFGTVASTPELSYDPDQPTLGIRYQTSLGGHALLAAAAHRLRADGERICNVVIMPDLPFSTEYATRKGYFTQDGVVAISPYGVRACAFDPPVQVDALPSTQLSDPQAIRRHVKFVNDPASELLLNDKRRANDLLNRSGIPHASALIPSIKSTSPKLLSFLEQTHRAQVPVVVKPALGERGDGVLMIDPSQQSADEMRARVQKTYVTENTLLVEPWLQSRPLYHPQTGIRQDWNIRAVVMGGRLAGAYARVAPYGAPINIAKGAQAESLEHVLDRCEVSPAGRKLLKRRLETLSKSLYDAVPANCMGIDVIVSDDLQPHIIELNGERSGGLNNSMTASRELPDWDVAISAVRNLHQALFMKRRNRLPAWRTPKNPAERTVPQLINGVFWANLLNKSKYRPAVVEELSLLNGLPEAEQREVDEALCYADYKDDPSPENIERLKAYMPEASLWQFHRLHDSGQRPEAFAALEQYAALQPLDRAHQRDSAQQLQASLKTAGEPYHGARGLQLDAARAYARTTYFGALRDTQTDNLAVSERGQQTLLQSLAAKYQVRQPGDPLLDLEAASLTEGERNYLQPAARYINGRQAIEEGNLGQLETIFAAGIENPTKADSQLAILWFGALENPVKAAAFGDSRTSCFQASLLLGHMGLASQFYNETAGERGLQTLAMEAFVNHEIQACPWIQSEEEAHRLWSIMIEGSAAAVQGDYDTAVDRMRQFDELTGGSSQIPFARTYDYTMRAIEQLGEGIRKL